MTLGGGMLLAALGTWLTPPWLLGVGAAIGLLVLAIGYGIAMGVSRRSGLFLHDALREGFLRPVLIVACVLAVIALAASPVVPVKDLIRSITRLPHSGKIALAETIAPGAQDQRVALDIRPAELKSLHIDSDEDVKISLMQFGIIKQAQQGHIEITAGEPYDWSRANSENNLFYGERSDESMMSIRNLSDKPAHLQFTGMTSEEFPAVQTVPQTAAALVGLVLLFLLFKALAPKIAAVALATAREVTVQPLFQIVAVVGAFALLVVIYIPGNTFGEDVKMLKSSDVTLIKILSVIVALWAASESVSGELEGRTAMTVLSKPIGRRQFLIGKFVGIILPVALLFLILGSAFLLTVSYKVVYDARESAKLEPNWIECYQAMITSVPVLVLAFFEAVALAALSVAISTRLSALATLIICCSVYVLGHLVPMLVASSASDSYGFINFTGQLFSAVLPVLDHFESEAAVATDAAIPLVYIAWAGLYCLLYSTVAMLVGLTLFEDRDLA
ncbi:MAG TPA: ABC transporter permease subunit [Pirellulales bacterium]|nr:ABC transporter permease subunit [Pirellulales bacterium]